MEEDEFATPKKKKNNLIIIAIVVFILIIAAFLFVGGNFPDLFSSEPSPVLVIGDLSPGERLVFDNLNQEFIFSIRSATDLENSSIEELKDYSIIIIDQTVTEKSISLDLGASLKNYVEKGGKLIIVTNSAIRTSLGLGGVEAGDSVGWANTLGDIAPAECILINGNEPSCKRGMKFLLLQEL